MKLFSLLFIFCCIYSAAFNLSAAERSFVKKITPKVDNKEQEFAKSYDVFNKELQKEKQPDNLAQIFKNMLDNLQAIKSPDKRIAAAGKVLKMVRLSEEKKVLGDFFDQVPRLVNTYLYGNKISMEAVSLLREYGELEFIEASHLNGIKNERNLKFQCYYVMPLNSEAEKLCKSWEKDRKLSKTEIRTFCSSARKAYLKKQTMVFPEKNIKSLVSIYYAFDNMNLKKSIAASMVMCGDYRQAYTLAHLLTEKEKSFAKELKLAIPEKYRGKNDPYFEKDIYEEK